MRKMSRFYGFRQLDRYAGEQYPDVDEGVAMCVLWKYRRSAHPETPNDATNGNVTVTRDKDECAAAPSCAQSDGLGVDETSLKVSI